VSKALDEQVELLDLETIEVDAFGGLGPAQEGLIRPLHR